ncbi:MAG: HAD hydrolase family protein [Terriglobales bacterium]
MSNADGEAALRVAEQLLRQLHPTMPNSDEVLALAGKVQLLLMDVDGVLTNGRLYNVPNAEGKMVETKGFDSQDGIGLQWLNWKGIKTGVISGRQSPATEERARQCKMAYVYQGHIEKIPILQEILADAKIESSQVAYIGDDFTDIVIMRRVGLAIATGNAREEVKRAAHYVTHTVAPLSLRQGRCAPSESGVS